jgi:DNA-binding response OmpR family regulator
VVILVVEDDELFQTIVEDALTEAGFEVAMVPTGEEAVTLLKGQKIPYRALVSDINLGGKIEGWEIARVARERASAPYCLYDRCSWKRLGISGRSRQRLGQQALCAQPTCDGAFEPA